MFRSYEFTYAGVAASMYGMAVYDLGSKKQSDNAFGNAANIVEKRLANRVKPIHYGVQYNDSPLSFSLIFGAEQEMDRYELQEIAQWLTGYQEYQWLTIDQPDMEHILFRCLIQSLTPISVGWLPVAFEAKIICDCPYGYSYPFEKVVPFQNGSRARFYNDGTSRELLKPEMQVSLAAGCTTFSVTNETTGETMRFANLPAGGASFTIDNENGVVSEESSGMDLYSGFNFTFFSAAAGDNILTFEGAGSITFRGRYLYNVGA